MSCADCYYCVYSHSPRASFIGSAKEPIGCCINCQAFACDQHGERSIVAEFVCEICKIIKPAANAGAVAEEADIEQGLEPRGFKRRLIRRLKNLFWAKSELPSVENINQYYQQHPSVKDEINRFIDKLASELANSNVQVITWKEDTEYRRNLREAIESFPNDAKILLFAAIFLIRKSESFEKFPPILQQIANSININW